MLKDFLLSRAFSANAAFACVTAKSMRRRVSPHDRKPLGSGCAVRSHAFDSFLRHLSQRSGSTCSTLCNASDFNSSSAASWPERK